MSECEYCKNLILGEHIEHKGQSYHIQCYKTLLRLRNHLLRTPTIFDKIMTNGNKWIDES